MHPQFTEPELSLIKSTWPQLPKKINAAYENPEKDIVIIFSGLFLSNIIITRVVSVQGDKVMSVKHVFFKSILTSKHTKKKSLINNLKLLYNYK